MQEIVPGGGEMPTIVGFQFVRRQGVEPHDVVLPRSVATPFVANVSIGRLESEIGVFGLHGDDSVEATIALSDVFHRRSRELQPDAPLSEIGSDDEQSEEGELRLVYDSRAAADRFATAHRLLHPPEVILAGNPNAGKSTLFNRLVGRRKAVVLDTPGITRDRNFETGEWNGRQFTFVDTGGYESDPRDAVFEQMREQRRAISREKRAIGQREAREVRARADRQARELLASARADAQVLRGEGDAESARIYAGAYNKDVEFYAFVRSLEAYRKALGDKTTLVVPPDHEFFRYLDLTPTQPGR